MKFNRSPMEFHEELLRYSQRWDSIRTTAYELLDIASQVAEAQTPEQFKTLQNRLADIRTQLREELTEAEGPQVGSWKN